jgi:hypothetical protein
VGGPAGLRGQCRPAVGRARHRQTGLTDHTIGHQPHTSPPPSTVTDWPVMLADSPETRNRTALAMSRATWQSIGTANGVRRRAPPLGPRPLDVTPILRRGALPQEPWHSRSRDNRRGRLRSSSTGPTRSCDIRGVAPPSQPPARNSLSLFLHTPMFP